jgi:DNA recombination protein RmuC
MTISTALYLALGTFVVGAVLGWLVHANRAGSARRSEEMELVRTHAQLEATRRESASLREQLDVVRDDAERRLAEAKEDVEATARRFKALAGDVLQANQQQFLELADQRLRSSTVRNDEVLAQREQAIRALVDPLSKAVEKVRSEVAEAEKARSLGHGALVEQMRNVADVSERLRTGTSELVTALRSSQTRGAWGELQLRRVVEAAGMLNRVDFTEQAQVSTEDGVLRPDMVVHLAGGKNVVVDSKVAFVGYLEAQQAEDAAVREQRLDAHVRHLLKHIDDLASKAYWSQFDPTPEFVVMFVPAEPFLAAAVDRKPDLLEVAARRNVILATPMTLVALLRTVAYAWQQEAVAEDAQEVLRAGKELHSRLVTMVRHVTKLGRSLGTATGDYNSFIASLETRVLPQARRMVELNVVDEKDGVAALRAIEEVPRPITKPELLVAEEGGVVAIETLSVTERTSVESLVAADREALAQAKRRHTDGGAAAG